MLDITKIATMKRQDMGREHTPVWLVCHNFQNDCDKEEKKKKPSSTTTTV